MIILTPRGCCPPFLKSGPTCSEPEQAEGSLWHCERVWRLDYHENKYDQSHGSPTMWSPQWHRVKLRRKNR